MALNILIIGTLIGLIAIYILSKKAYGQTKFEFDLDDYTLKDYLFIGLFGYEYLSRFITFKKNRNSIHQMYGQYNFVERYRLFVAERLTLAYAILLVFTILSLGVSIKGDMKQNELSKNEFEKGDHYTYYDYVIDEEGLSAAGELRINVPAIEATPSESLDYVNLAIAYVEANLSKNEYGLYKTYSKLNCPDSYKLVTIKWKSSNSQYLLNSGQIRYVNIVDYQPVELTATYLFQDISIVKTYDIVLYPLPISASEEVLESVLLEAIDNQTDSTQLLLPNEIDGYAVNWYEKKAFLTEAKMFVMGILLAILFYFLKAKSLEEKVTNRQENILIRLPYLINKISLLIQAGMTFHGAWNKIIEDYIRLKNSSSIKYELYEEMIITQNDMARGTSELIAYEMFSKRIGLKEVFRFITIVTQNIRKGNRMLSTALMDLSYQSWQQREIIAKTKGEKASTKMVIPMALMLIAILIMILTPAVLSLQI